jgi:hypothetical protein
MATRKSQPTDIDSTVDTTVDSTVETAEIVPSQGYSDQALKNVQTFEEAAALAAEVYGLEYASDLIGDGFSLVKGDDAKRRLVGRPMVVMEWTFHPGDFGSEFVAARIVTPSDSGAAQKFIVTDGSTGIYKQLREMTDQYGKKGGMIVHSGFRESSYLFCSVCQQAVNPTHDPAHKVGPASTFYLDPTRKQLSS